MFGVDVLWHFYELFVVFIFFFKQKTAYEMRISDWSSDVCSSDLFPNHQSRITASMASIGVIDYGMGNLHSLGKALERVSESGRVVISYDQDELLKDRKSVLPGKSVSVRVDLGGRRIIKKKSRGRRGYIRRNTSGN